MDTISSILRLCPRMYETLSDEEFDELFIIVSSREDLKKIQSKHPSVPAYQVEKGYTDMVRLKRFVQELKTNE